MLRGVETAVEASANRSDAWPEARVAQGVSLCAAADEHAAGNAARCIAEAIPRLAGRGQRLGISDCPSLRSHRPTVSTGAPNRHRPEHRRGGFGGHRRDGLPARGCSRLAVRSAKHLVNDLRSLLRFLFLEGLTPTALATAGPTPSASGPPGTRTEAGIADRSPGAWPTGRPTGNTLEQEVRHVGAPQTLHAGAPAGDG